MIARAHDLMKREFHTLRLEMTMAEAFEQFSLASKAEKQRVMGMVVTDANGRLKGMLSMYDILPLIRPSRTHNWEEMDDAEVVRLMETSCERIRSIRVGDIMTHNVITIHPTAHVMEILDIMIRRHIRRLPVLDGEKIVGIVYISSVFRLLGEVVRGIHGK